MLSREWTERVIREAMQKVEIDAYHGELQFLHEFAEQVTAKIFDNEEDPDIEAMQHGCPIPHRNMFSSCLEDHPYI